MDFRLFTSNRMECLADALCDHVLRQPLSSPFRPDVIVINSKGLESWLKQQVARRLGISCQLTFPFLNTFVSQILARLPEADRPSSETPAAFSREVMQWQLFSLLEEVLAQDDPEMEPLRHYVEGPGDPVLRRLQLAGRIAHVFDQYQIFRPEMLEHWEQGELAETPATDRWQPSLWQTLTASSTTPSRKVLFQRLAREFPALDLSDVERVSLFGISTLPPVYLYLFTRLAERVPVNVFLLNPCRQDWHLDLSDTRRSQAAEALLRQGLPRGEDYLETGNPLLSSLGALGQEFLTELLEQTGYPDVPQFVPAVGTSLLAMLQNDILDRRDGRESPPPPVSPTDESIQIHGCHSRLREIEVLRDRLLAMFEADPELRPREILVMAPEIGDYVPFVESVFGHGEGTSAEDIPFTVADHSPGRESRVVQAFLMLLGLPRSRLKASEVLDLLSAAPIHRAFGLHETALELLRGWLAETGVRWGLDAAHRNELGLPAFAENSWQFGLDRLLLGYAMDSDSTPAEALPLNGRIMPTGDLEGDAGEVLGHVARFVAELRELRTDLQHPRSPQAWSESLTSILDRFFARDNESYQELLLVRRAVDAFRQATAQADATAALPCLVVESCLRTSLEGERYAAAFFRGKVTFCSMLPMRSIPAKVICLLGLDDGVFPRSDQRLGFDLIARQPRRCDRSRRLDDRYLFLEAVVSARQCLYLSYQGRTVRENTRIPPSVLVAELRDYLTQAFELPPGREAPDGHPLACFETEHPLQAFSQRYFDSSDPHLFSYSGSNHAAAAALAAGPKEALFLPHHGDGLPPPSAEEALNSPDLEELCRFFRHPCRFLVERRLKATLLRQDAAGPEDCEPFDVDALTRYQLDQTLLADILAGRDLQRSYAVARAEAQLPVGAAGRQELAGRHRAVLEFLNTPLPDALARHCPGMSLRDVLTRRPEGLTMPPVRVSVGDVVYELSGRAEPNAPGLQVLTRFSRLKARDAILGLVRHLAFCLCHPADEACRTAVIGSDRQILFGPLDAADRDALLTALVNAYHCGLSRPLPFVPDISWIYYKEHRKSENAATALAKARDAWFGNERSGPAPAQDPYYHLCFGDAGPMAAPGFESLATELFSWLQTCAEIPFS